MRRLRRALTLPLRLYQRWLSPLKPPMCRFSPTCSQYAIEAIEVHGVLRGVPLTHCALLLETEEGRSFAVAMEEAAIEQAPTARPVRGNSRVVEWLRQSEDVLVKDELKVNPRLVDFFEGAENELEELHASLILAL